MKKTHFIFSILTFSFVMGTAINLPTFAAADNVTVVSNRDEVTAALQSVRDLPGYNTYAQMDNATREQATPLFREYRYLAELVKTGEGLLADPTASAEDLNMIVRAANDAVKGCKLIFANTNTNSSSNQLLAPSRTPSTLTLQLKLLHLQLPSLQSTPPHQLLRAKLHL